MAQKTLSELLMSQSLLPAPQSNNATARALIEGSSPSIMSEQVMPDRGMSAADRFQWGSTPAGGMELAANLIGGPTLRGVTQGIRAFHGSPHKFDKFSMDRIGTGEGAQAYGHGLYFAENEATAKAYRDQLAGNSAMGRTDLRTAGVGGNPYSANDPVHVAAYYRHLYGGRAAKELEKEMSFIAPRDERKGVTDQTIQLLRGKTEIPRFDPKFDVGHMYEVNIRANPEQFLDWDRPLSGQPQAAAAVNRVAPQVLDTALGQGAHSLVGDLHGLDKAGVSNALREAGIPGIKYLDQGSRWDPARAMAELTQTKADYAKWQNRPDATPDLLKSFEKRIGEIEGQINSPRSSNYVVFDDSIIDILKRYGLAGGAAASPIASALMEPQPQ
jgi:hypothetical protein